VLLAFKTAESCGDAADSLARHTDAQPDFKRQSPQERLCLGHHPEAGAAQRLSKDVAIYVTASENLSIGKDRHQAGPLALNGFVNGLIRTSLVRAQANFFRQESLG
jgi:hypothetical protein